MRVYPGQVEEILTIAGQLSARLTCPPQAVPAPGQFVLVKDEQADLPFPLFLKELSPQGFIAAPFTPSTWSPGTSLQLFGPHGRGFHLPDNLRRLGLIALGNTVARLLPLADTALSQHTDVALFTNNPLPAIPYALEVFPLSTFPEYYTWPDYLVVDLPLESIPRLRSILRSPDQLQCPTQALILTSMPCGGLAGCGVCALLTRTRKWKLACKDGPVFALSELEW